MNDLVPNRVVHLELHTSDAEQARAFYAEVCGWRPERILTRHGAYVAVELGTMGGGFVECPTQRSLWLPYVAVADVHDATARARENGAVVLLEPREGPAGWRAVVATPAGGELAFWEAKRR
jgi:hypothetical protein